MDIDAQSNLPGGTGFTDVTTVFTNAARDMEPDEHIFSASISLQDAMSAFEIGEPRLDSGFILEGERRPPFNPLAALLPEELCWILDRSFTCEIEWHFGNTLSQTVFTFLFVHYLNDIDPELVSRGPKSNEDPFRPLELITIVLRSAVFGLLKCCDLSWRELSRGAMQDGEDWQGEKCDISLLEGYPVKFVLGQLDDAADWLSTSSKVPVSLQNALLARILLRKAILELLDMRVHKDGLKFKRLVSTARNLLDVIRDHPSPEPPPDSLAISCFDPLVARRLNSFVPFRILELRDLSRTWEAMEGFIDGFDELSLLATTKNMSTWAIAGNIRLWLPEPPQRVAYIRSSTQCAFFDGASVLNNYNLVWIVDRFFIETLGLPYKSLCRAVTDRWAGFHSPPFEELERRIIQLITSHIRGLWFNPPRRRRHLMKSILNWHALYHLLLEITSQLSSTNQTEVAQVLNQLPNAALVWRLSIVREVIFSGFQLELYSAEERPFAYWYASHVMEKHLAVLDDMVPVVTKDSAAYSEIAFQSQFLSALQIMSMAMFSVSMKFASVFGRQSRHNFLRRYKWVFRPGYDEIDTPLVTPPEFTKFMPACAEMSHDEFYSPSDSINLARDILMQLIERPVECAGPWNGDVVRFLENLVNTCERLPALPMNMKDLSTFDVTCMKWDPRLNPWFPIIKEHREGSLSPSFGMREDGAENAEKILDLA